MIIMFERGKDMNSDKNNRTFKKHEVIILMVITFIVSILLGFSISSLTNIPDKLFKNKPKQDSYIENFVKNYNYIVKNYYKKVDKSKLIDKAISGMMESLDDPYSVYMDADESSSFNISLDGQYQGLGIQIAKDEEKKEMVVLYVFKDSPADKAGLKVGDYITKINNKDLSNKTPTEFSNMVLNSSKTEFDLTIIRNEKQQTVTIAKNSVVIDSVMSEVYERNKKKIGYIYISIFANNTPGQFKKKLDELEDKRIDSLIIDVRSNTGGHLTAVEYILESLLTKKQITYQIKTKNKQLKFYGKAKYNKKYEIVLLGNGDSASASEILIASLMDNYGSKFFGEKTYGKGTVQELIDMSDNQQYKITTKKWLTPKGKWINDTKGIKPTDEVKFDGKYNETHASEDDNQLQAVLQYLENR